MRVDLVGADFEENLALGILSAVVEQQGHQPRVVVFNHPSEIGRLVERITEDAPEVVGLSMQFQHRADEFLTLARGLRDAGYRGHITCGGQFPTLATAETLECNAGVDSVVLYDGEETLADLLAALETGQPLSDVPGLALLSDDGKAFRTRARPLIEDLDAVPIAKRYRPHSKHLDVPFIPITGGRGCWGRCSYCAIMSTYRDAKARAGGRLLRLRSPESIAEEMAQLWHAAGGQGIFCFHDENLLLPKPKASLQRLRAIRAELYARGVDEIAIIGKCRPDSLTHELCRELPDLGVIRLYVGVENMSERGARHFARGEQRDAVHRALAACRKADIFTCYNLLVFEPGATLADVRDNCEFMRDHPEHPVNFCRAEPYFGTPLHDQIARRKDLHGSFLGYNYRIADDRTEVLHRIVTAAFAERNFAPDGVINRYMSLGYNAKLLEWFHAPDGGAEELRQRAHRLTVDITLDSARLLERAIGIAERNEPDDFDTIERQTGLLCLEVAKMDAQWHAALDALGQEMVAFVADPPAPRQRPRRARPRMVVPAGFAVGMTMAIAAAGCESSTTVDPAPGGMGGTAGSGTGGNVADPAPGGMGGTVVDMAPGGMGGMGGSGGIGGNIADPAPGGMGGTGGQGGNAALLLEDDQKVASRSLPLVDHWRDSSARKAERTRDLPLFAPPKIALLATRERDLVKVELTDPGVAYTAVWQAQGERIGEGLTCRWKPRGPEDRLSVALRTEGGVAVASLGAQEAGYG